MTCGLPFRLALDTRLGRAMRVPEVKSSGAIEEFDGLLMGMRLQRVETLKTRVKEIA
jgi:hypothetical protein